MDHCDPARRAEYEADLRAIAVNAALVGSGRTTTSTVWDIWCSFCNSIGCDTPLCDTVDPIPALQLFAHRYRLGKLSPSGAHVRARTVEQALRTVGRTLAFLGCLDPWLQPSGKLDICLSRQLAVYKRMDNPPMRVKPIPVPILQYATAMSHNHVSGRSEAIASMITLGFYFLLRPGEYAVLSSPTATPFRLCDIHLHFHNRRIHHLTCPLHE